MDKHLIRDWYELKIEDDIFFITYADNVIVNGEVARQLLEDREMMCQGKKYLHCGDARKVKYWTKEARISNASERNYELMIAAAVVYKSSHVTNVLLNFFLKYNKPPVPAKFCATVEEGVEWLKGLKL